MPVTGRVFLAKTFVVSDSKSRHSSQLTTFVYHLLSQSVFTGSLALSFSPSDSFPHLSLESNTNMRFALVAAVLATTALAVQVTFPTETQGWDTNGSEEIEWKVSTHIELQITWIRADLLLSML